ncbi:MAG TPA: ATP-binding cassette domain-containing protein [Planctomycetaceae bacterium]|nr:ATP-binding cassette domain-containing protein [Planctomycetaceae bacterium]
MLELRRVSKSYAGRIVLQPTDLTIAGSRVSVLIGPSGCGKSTLLRLMIGLLEPDAGSVHFQGAELTRDRRLAARRQMGYVIQSGGLFPHLTAEGNVTLLARHLGWSANRIAERVRALADLTHFPLDGLGRYPVQLSGGQQQRVGLMRALMLDPDLLLLDEPLGALDPLIRADLQDDLKQVFLSLGKTVVLVTHDLSEAAFFGETIVLLREGRIVQQGTLDDFLHRPADPFVTRFLHAQRRSLLPRGEAVP